MDLSALLKNCGDHVRSELASMPEVQDVVDFDPTTEAPPITARRWYRVPDTVVVVADLKSSTKLGVRKYAQSTASIYEAALRPVVDIFHELGAGWIPIHGDCVIGIFWDGQAIERAVCAGITAKTFSEDHLVPQLEQKWTGDKLPATGFKVGIATSSVLVKRVGRPASSHQDLVWPGKAVNYAVKAAQTADAHELVVTGSVWDAIDDNDYLTFSCDCGDPSPALWQDHTIDKLEHDDVERTGRRLTSKWCSICGQAFCTAILAGATRREIAQQYRDAFQRSRFSEAIAKKNSMSRRDRANLQRARIA